MKQNFTKLLSAVALLSLLFIGFAASAQTLASLGTPAKKTDTAATEAVAITKKAKVEKAAEPDTAWKPQRRLWGYAFGDFPYFDQHSPAVTSTLGKENNYYQIPSNRNAFQFRRFYLGYDYEITRRFKAEVLLASEPNANSTPTNGTSGVTNSDNLGDGKLGFFIKNFNLRYRDIYPGADLVVGEMATPGFALNEPGTNAPTSLSEATWGYRSVERTITDFHKNNSYDIGAAIQGTFDPATKNFGYVLMLANNTTSTASVVYNPNNAVGLTNPNPNTGFYKIFYGDIWGKFFDKHLYADFYVDAAPTAPTQPTVGPQEHNMFKGFLAYTTKVVTVGVEAYTQKIKNGVQNTTAVQSQDATVNGISFWIRGAIVKDKLGYLARYDNYNPDTKFINSNVYTVNTNYGSYDPSVKERFYTFGLDFTPTKNVHIMPNVWLTQYLDQYAATTKGYQPDNHTLVYRLTFFYTFGK